MICFSSINCMMFFLAAAWLAFEVSSRFANFMIAEAIDAVSSGLNPIIFPFDNSLKTAMSETAAFNPQAAASGYANGYTAPNATRNVQSVAIADATGVITVTTTAAAGGGTLTITPNAPVGTALPNAAGSAFTPPAQSVAWRCAALNAANSGFTGFTAGTLPARFAPSECK